MLARWRKYGEIVHDDQDNLLEADYVEVQEWLLPCDYQLIIFAGSRKVI